METANRPISNSGTLTGLAGEDALWERREDAAARDELAARYMDFARRIALSFRTGPEPVDDLVQVASLALVKAIDHQLSMLLLGGPDAIRECKALIAMVDGHALAADRALRRRTAEVIAQMRVADEGQEGLKAFLDKRKPSWVAASK